MKNNCSNVEAKEPEKRINVRLSIEEIVLIKECLFESEQKQAAFSKNVRNNIAIRKVSQDKADSLKKLIERLEIFGYGYQ